MPSEILETLKICPFCAEEIQSAAIKCKHCQSLLTQNTSQPVKSSFGTNLKNALLNKPKWTPAKVFVACFVLFMVILLITGSKPSNDKAASVDAPIQTVIVKDTPEENKTEPAPVVEEPAKTQDDLGISSAEFKARFNSAARNNNVNLRVHLVSTKSDATEIVEAFEIDQNIALLLKSSKSTGNISSATLVGSAKKSKECSNLILSMGLVMEVFNPELSQQDRDQLYIDLSCPNGDESKPTFDGTAIRNNIGYMMTPNTGMGIWLTVFKKAG